MAIILRMPEISANATHATLVNWHKKTGDTVSAGDSLADIETEKAIIELNAETQGVLGRLLVNNGDEVPVGAPIVVLLAPGETQADADRLLAGVVDDSPLVDNVAPAPTVSPGVEATANRRIFSSPVARLLARERGVDLATVRGTGPNGRVIKYDVMLAIQALGEKTLVVAVPPAVKQPTATTPATAGASTWTEVPHSSMRRTIARRLTESKTTVPHFYLSVDCRVDRLVSMRAELNAGQSQKISVNDFVLRAAALALREVPGVNVAWTDAALLQFHAIDIALAVSTDKGLITPIIRDAASKSLLAISTEARTLAARARDGQLRADEFQGGGFSVSNLGMYGIEEFSAIINPPQAGILAVGATRAQPVVDEGGQIRVGQVMRCTLSVDHRAVDGALAAAWLAAFRRLLEAPVTLLI